MTHRDTVHQLEAEFADAMNRMYAVGNGLARLRAELDRESTGSPRPQPAPTPVAQAASAPAGPVSTPSTAAAALAMASGTGPAAPPVAPPSVFARPDTVRSEPWYRREGAVTRALALTGAVVTMAGVAMLLVLAAQQGWFGPVARVSAGALLAGVLAAVGVRNGEAELRLGRVRTHNCR